MRWVLLVEDHDDNRELLAVLLQAEGIEVRAFRAAHEALAHVASRGAPDLVITALMMEDVDGVALTRSLRRALPGCCPKIFALTGLPRFDDSEGLFDRVLVKPVEPGDFVAIVRGALGSDD